MARLIEFLRRMTSKRAAGILVVIPVSLALLLADASWVLTHPIYFEWVNNIL